MNTKFYLLSLLGGLFWGGLNLARKKLTDGYSYRQIMVILTSGMALVGFLLTMFGAGSITGLFAVPYLKVGLLLAVINTTSNLAFLRALHHAPLTLSVPLLSLSPVWASAAAWLLLEQSLTAIQMTGIAATMVGNLLVQWQTSVSSVTRARLWMLLVSLLWGIMLPLDRLAIEASNLVAHFSAQASLMLLFFGAWLLINNPTPPHKSQSRHIGWLIAAVALVVGAYLNQMYLVLHTESGLIEALKRGVEMLFTWAVGRHYLRERIAKRQTLGFAIVVVGILLLY